MKNLDYIRKYELFVAEPIGSRPIDQADNQRHFLQDLYIDYKANLEVVVETKGEINIKTFDQIYAQMKQKLNSLSRKTPWDLPHMISDSLDNMYNSFIKEYCPVFYNKIEEISGWEYSEQEHYHDGGFVEFFHSYNFSTWRRDYDFSKYPKIVKIAFDIYMQKKRQHEQREKEEEKRRERIHQERMRTDPQYRANQTFRGYSNFFFGYSHLFDLLFQGMSKPTDSFTTLGLSNDATVDEVKSAYRKLSLQHHPDKGGSSEKFIEITEARDKCLAYLK